MSNTLPPDRGNRRIEQGQQSRARLVAEARRLFERDGYGKTSTEGLLAATGLTRGALYHHFRDKKDLFAAVCEDVHAELAAAIEAATTGIADPARQLIAGSLAWIDAVSQPGARQVLLIDAPSVLGAAEWQALDDRHGFQQLREAVLHILRPQGAAATLRAEALAAALNGAMNALVHWRARHDGGAAQAALRDVLNRVFDALLAPPPAKATMKRPTRPRQP
ncbi:TetR/AcrR family transcriptional regulator [Aquincola sp. S2]|uniref:TetR/AcrR family transcriptional regulator n=1 Tax=Pseudaquabacterium terrae TaxID=2732868 RepID=A0ABX2EI27_9BURK|nr:TetR/AcrR family transcriptional regulator [Aquabacterium terrae]NRF68277.1 TetR/AcrR family transcriptional regulator [Aquabacterium terrae]